MEAQLANSMWEIPEDSHFENLQEWRRDRLALTNPAARGNTSRGRAYSRGRSSYAARGRGGGRGSQQTYYRENDSYTQDREYGAPERYSSGVGRSSGGARERERVREISPRVGYRDMEDNRAYYRDEGRPEDYPDEPSRPGPSRYEERAPYQRPYRDYYDQDEQEDYYPEDRPSREGGRGNRGADRARTYGYRGRET